MKRDKLSSEFIRARAEGETLEEICYKLDISKPTAIKWNKLYRDEILEMQKFIMVRIFSDKIIKHENKILVRLDNLKKVYKEVKDEDDRDRINSRMMKQMENIFLKRLRGIQLQINYNEIVSATFTFEDDE